MGLSLCALSLADCAASIRASRGYQDFAQVSIGIIPRIVLQYLDGPVKIWPTRLAQQIRALSLDVSVDSGT